MNISPRYRAELAERKRLKNQLLDEQLEEFGYNFCMTCGRSGLWLSLSHVIPVSRGGETSKDNCILEDIFCHQRFEKKPEERPAEFHGIKVVE